jgi:hypothetical protein
MKEHLQPWYDRWLKANHGTDLSYVPKNSRGEPSLEQVHFVRDYLSGILWADVPYDKRGPAPPRDTCKETGFVIGEHTSKSVRLPVYSLERPDLGIQFVLRDNYHDWNVSVLSEKPITTDLRGFELDYSRDEDLKRFPNGYKPGSAWGYCYFQGFPEEVQFGPFKENPCKFSLCIGNDYSVHNFIWLIMRDIRGISPWRKQPCLSG